MQDNKYWKYIGGLVLITVVFLVGISVGRGYQQTPTPQPTNQSEAQSVASLMIDYGDGRIKTYSDLSVNDQSTIFDVLKQAAEKNNIDLQYKDFGGELGIFIETIDGVGKDPAQKKWWQFWVNNKYSQTGVGSYKVQAGDVIQFKFTEGQE